MPNTYTQLYIHIIFAVKGRQPLISKQHKEELQQYIKGWLRGRFEWQTGFAAFTYSHSHLDTVANYIKNQEKHHARLTFREEYLIPFLLIILSLPVVRNQTENGRHKKSTNWKFMLQ